MGFTNHAREREEGLHHGATGDRLAPRAALSQGRLIQVAVCGKGKVSSRQRWTVGVTPFGQGHRDVRNHCSWNRRTEDPIISRSFWSNRRCRCSYNHTLPCSHLFPHTNYEIREFQRSENRDIDHIIFFMLLIILDAFS